MTSQADESPGWPRRVLLAGFERGAGPWLREHLLPDLARAQVEVLDAVAPDPAGPAPAGLTPAGPAPAVPAQANPAQVSLAQAARAAAPPEPALAVVAVPEPELPGVAERLAGRIGAGSDVVVVTAGSMRALEVLAAAAKPGDWNVCGLHMLFDIYRSGPAGQTCYVVTRAAASGRERLLADAVARRVEQSGGVVVRGDTERHDAAMAVVGSLTQRVLVSFVDEVLSSGLDLEDELWRARTPLFEALLSLGVSALDTRRENSLAAAQLLPAAGANERAFRDALARFDEAVRSPDGLPAHLAQVREAFTGAGYDSLRRVGATALAAIQGTRAALSRYRRSGELVGLRTSTGAVRVGRVVASAPSTVTLEELLVGPRGRAALLIGPGVRNARRLGVAGRSVRTTFALGHVSVLEEEVLQRELDAALGVLVRDVRFLVPESVSGAGVLAAVRSLRQVRSASAVDEVVRVGQRSVVLRLGFRADHDVETAIEEVRAHVAGTYRWPAGVALALADGAAPDGAGRADRAGRTIGYLGPAGSFSHVAAGLASGLLRPGASARAQPEEVPHASFEDVVEAVRAGSLGVLPISSSASGLVTRAVEALLRGGDGVRAGGMVDVAVRFDAYGQAGTFLEDLRGARVLGHPQALAQCGAFVRRWGLRPQEVASNSRALELLAVAEEATVAIGVQDAGAALGLVTLEREIDDLPGSLTRFLLLGPTGVFGEPRGGARPTLRRVLVGRDATAAFAAVEAAPSCFSELLTDAAGRYLLVTSAGAPVLPTASDAVVLGELPWSPRTPVVRPDPTTA